MKMTTTMKKKNMNTRIFRKGTQLPLIKEPRSNTKRWWIEKHHVFGGSIQHRKYRRPFDTQKLVHLVLKANLGNSIYFTRSQKYISELLKTTAERYGVKLKSFSINKDHIHILCHSGSRHLFINFLRYFSAKMGRIYKKIYSRFGLTKTKSLWRHRPFTRLVRWSRKTIAILQNYIRKNTLEALGFVEYTPRNHQLSKFLTEYFSSRIVDNYR